MSLAAGRTCQYLHWVSRNLMEAGMGSNRKYIVRLTEEERRELRAMVKKGRVAAYKIKHANIPGADAPGSWLNIAECELSVLSRQCLGKRTSDMRSLKRKVNPWKRDRNRRQRGVDWRFTTADARIKLKRLYPQVQMS